MDLADKLQDVIHTHVRGLKHTPSGWHKANCPVCATRGHRPDRRERFGVLFQSDGFGMNCFNCGFGARWQEGSELSRDLREFLRAVGLSTTDIDALVFEAYVNRHGLSNPTQRTLQGNPQVNWLSRDLPPDTLPVSVWLDAGCEDPHFLEVAEYAVDRGIRDLTRVSWTPHTDHKMNHRLIVPFVWNRRVVGFTGRMVGRHATRRNRYYHEIPNHFVYNLDTQESVHREYTIITEGVFDALLVDGVAVLHNKIHPQQAHIINRLHTRKIVCPDRDADGEELVNAAIEHGWAVSFPPWERGVKDAGDAVMRYGVLYTTFSIIQHAISDPDKIRLWRRLDLEKYGDKRIHT